MGERGVLATQSTPSGDGAATLFCARPTPLRPRARTRGKIILWVARALSHPLFTAALTIGGLGASVAFALERSGDYAKFAGEFGAPGNVAARVLGMGVEHVTISGLSELTEARVLELAGVSERQSLPYLDAGAMREKLMSAPLIAGAQVKKLFPNRLSIDVEERKPFALWQNDGKVKVVATDGVVIEDLHDERFLALPQVVGAGANEKLSDYSQILNALGDLSTRIRAGALVSGRRWTLYSREGVEIRLPENPAPAAAMLAVLQRERRILDKDVLLIDLRDPGRLVVRLNDEAAERRLEILGKGKA